MEVLPSPGMMPTSQEAGNGVHDPKLAMTAPGSPPGFDAGNFGGEQPWNNDTPPAPDGPDGPQIPVSTQDQPKAGWRPGGGVWVTDTPVNSGVPAPGGGWANV